jgi:hypothetical protein
MNALQKLVIQSLKNLFPIVTVEDNYEALDVDSIKISAQSHIETSSSRNNYSSVYSIKRTEPKVELTARLLQTVLKHTSFLNNAGTIPVSGFRLNNIKHWLHKSEDDVDSVINYLADTCNCNCINCHWKMNPPEYMKIQRKNVSSEEIATRLKYFSGSTSIFEQGFNEICESLNHPMSIDILKGLRRKTKAPFFLMTTGKVLTEELVKEISEIGSCILAITFNSSNKSTREEVMRDKEPETAISSLGLLKKYKIPFIVTIEPRITMSTNDIVESISFVSQFSPYMIEIYLPGYTKHASEKYRFDSTFWNRIVESVREIKKNTATPIMICPNLFEENYYQPEKVLLPIIHSVIEGSPAEKCGLKGGDGIIKIGEKQVSTREELINEIYSLSYQNKGQININIIRENIKKELLLELSADSTYPYIEIGYHPFGIIVARTIAEADINKLISLVNENADKKMVFLTSKLIQPVYERLLKSKNGFSESSSGLKIEVPKNNFFGGNISMGDLITMQDIIDHINNNKEDKPDLVIIPSSLFYFSKGWLRDLTGTTYMEIERKTNTKVAILGCEPIW